ncbi:unnamed protein product [Soboliphyme baturini]|uniref:Fibronectin type-III domain-containing protein n=1 Tax=Soboliphyme baturini TaxID=241478 RepID=A0A183IIQ5_9BILA|nr:unnamed protein product [Soboliphyme baturini]
MVIESWAGVGTMTHIDSRFRFRFRWAMLCLAWFRSVQFGLKDEGHFTEPCELVCRSSGHFPNTTYSFRAIYRSKINSTAEPPLNWCSIDTSTTIATRTRTTTAQHQHQAAILALVSLGNS